VDKARYIALIGIGVGAVLIGLGYYRSHTPAPPVPEPSPVHYSLTVLATESWKNSEITVRSGQRISVFASGRVVWDKMLPAVGPDGSYPANTVEQPNDFPLPSAPCGSLLMKVGSTIYPVGSSRTVTVNESGGLLFMINDRYNYLHNNSGSFQVELEVR
jgi:hypothetical protein